MRFLFLTMEATNSSALKRAAATLNRTYGTRLEVTVITIGLSKSPQTWSRLEEMIATSDFIFGSMLFSEEIVRPLERMLANASCPVCIITSNPALLAHTRFGRFSLGKDDDPGKKKTVFTQWADKFKPKHQHGESQRQLAMVRNLSRLLKHLPGKARDIHTFIAAHQFWLNGSEENMQRFIALLAIRYGNGFDRKLPLQDPLFYPDTGLWHPDAPEPFTSVREFRKWQQPGQDKETTGCILVLCMRATILSRNTEHIKALVTACENKGLDTLVAYSGGLDFLTAINAFIAQDNPAKLSPDLLVNATGFSLVGGPAESRPGEAIEALTKVGIPYINLLQLSFQTISEWRSGNMGLTPLQTALSLAVPELDGAIEPHVFAGTPEGSDRTLPLQQEVEAITERLSSHISLRRKPNAEKNIAIVLFNFPPNLGNAGTAALLDVFESLYRLLEAMKADGYLVDLPADSSTLRNLVTEGNRNIYGTDGNVAAHLDVQEYRRIAPWYHEIEKFWGDAPGELLNDGSRFHILGCRLGNIFIGQQPSFGYERDPMRLLMAKDAAPNHGFAAFYSWLEHTLEADAVIHFGTHGALEFMPGKQAGLAVGCWPKRLIGSLPNFYYYSVNNPSEAAIAKRRSFATILSYLTPPLEQAGLYRELRTIRDLIDSWYGSRDAAILDDIEKTASHIELPPPEEGEHSEERINRLGALLYELEERMIPLGLHVIGKQPEPEELLDQLTLLASHARPELDNRSLLELVCEARGYDASELRRQADSNHGASEEWKAAMNTVREAVRRFIGTLPPEARTATEQSRMLEATYPVRKAEANAWLQKAGTGKGADLESFWQFIQRLILGCIADREIPAMLEALSGRYIEPSPSSDLVRNPEIVPTGRNTHSLDPFRMPTTHAIAQGRQTAESLLEQGEGSQGSMPESIAIVLWGTDNMKSGGEGIAQALALIGAEPLQDELGKISSVRLIPLEELQRPRIDVVVTISGIFRDLLSHQTVLLDKAVRLAAEAEEPPELNFIRKHVDAECRECDIPREKAASRIFANAPGSYGANVNHLIESSSWQESQELADTFINRKSFAVNGRGEWEECPDVLTSALRNVSMTFQNIDSYEMGISDIDHYYEYLGGVSKTVEVLSGSKPRVMVGDIDGLGKRQNISKLEEMVSLEARTKLLNPKWYESMLEHGYEGVREIESRLSNTYGWSATAGAVQNWTYRQFNETYLRDPAMLERLKTLNPHATMSMTGRLLEANSRGFWETDRETIEELKELYADLESRVEGLHMEE